MTSQIMSIEHIEHSEQTLDIKRIWNSYSTICKILVMRGYKLKKPLYTSEKDLVEKLDNQKPDDIRDSLSIFGTKNENETPNDRIMVRWEKDKIITALLSKYTDELEEKEIANCIVIAKYQSSPGKSIEELRQNLKHREAGNMFNIFLTILNEDTLQYNIFEHELMPKYVPLSTDEKKKVMQFYSVTESQIPKMKLSGVVATLLGLKKGDMLEITMPSPTLHGCEKKTYRIVF